MIKDVPSNKIKVSVCIIAYNHERYIAQSLESAINQDVDFIYEIVVGEDCSTDKTRAIALEYQERFPDKIRVKCQKRNLGMHRNFAETLGACCGEYVALLEGDDYWRSPLKLAKQVSFLDKNRDCAACFHSAKISYEDKETSEQSYRGVMREKYSLEDILAGGFHIPTASCMFRRGLFGDLPKWVSTLAMADLPLHIMNAEHGYFGYIDELMSVYRSHRGGVWTGGVGPQEWPTDRLKANTQGLIDVYKAVNQHLGFRYDELIRDKISIWNYDIVWAYQRDRNAAMMRKYLIAAWRERLFNSETSFNYVLKAWLMATVPVLLRFQRSHIKSAQAQIANG